MVMVNVNGTEWYEDKKFLSNLNVYLDAMKDNDDLVIVFDGAERSGKSKRLRQVGAYCADYLGTKFGNHNIKQDLQEYMDFSIESPLYTVCIMDEGRNQLNRKNSNSKLNKKFTNFLSECGKRRQVHIIALPAYHDLDKYLVLWRMKFVIHMHKWYQEDSTRKSGYRLGRGRFTMYMNDDYLRDCYDNPYRYPKRWECKAEYRNVEVLSDEELKLYEANKDLNIEKRYHSKYVEEELGKLEKMWKTRCIKLIDHCNNARGIRQGELADAMGMEIGTLKTALSRSK